MGQVELAHLARRVRAPTVGHVRRRPGAAGRFELRSDDGEVARLANKPGSVEVGPEAAIVVTTAGAGGHGPAAERTAEAFAGNRRSGKLSFLHLVHEYSKAE